MNEYPVECRRCHALAFAGHFDDGVCASETWLTNGGMLADALRLLDDVANERDDARWSARARLVLEHASFLEVIALRNADDARLEKRT